VDTHPRDTSLVETVKPATQRRRYSKAMKRQIVEECLTGRESASKVARRHDINANLLFTWRRQYEAGIFGNQAASPALVPIIVKPRGQTCPPTSASPDPAAHRGSGHLDIHLASGHRLVVTGAACPVALQTALEILSK
jgi:transposase